MGQHPGVGYTVMGAAPWGRVHCHGGSTLGMEGALEGPGSTLGMEGP